MHAASALFTWSKKLLAFASRQFESNYGPLSASFLLFWSIISLRASVAGGSGRPRSEAPCIYTRCTDCLSLVVMPFVFVLYQVQLYRLQNFNSWWVFRFFSCTASSDFTLRHPTSGLNNASLRRGTLYYLSICNNQLMHQA